MTSELYLKPCPFCGGTAGFELIERGGLDTWSVGCRSIDDDCIAGQMLMTFTRKGEAAEAWNKRVIIIDQPAQNKLEP